MWYFQIYIYRPTDILHFSYSYSLSTACFQYWSAFCCVTWWWNPHWVYRNNWYLQYFYWMFCATGYLAMNVYLKGLGIAFILYFWCMKYIFIWRCSAYVEIKDEEKRIVYHCQESTLFYKNGKKKKKKIVTVALLQWGVMTGRNFLSFWHIFIITVMYHDIQEWLWTLQRRWFNDKGIHKWPANRPAA